MHRQSACEEKTDLRPAVGRSAMGEIFTFDVRITGFLTLGTNRREEIKNWGENRHKTDKTAQSVVKTPLVSLFKDDWIKISAGCALLAKIWKVGFEISMSNFGYPIFRFLGFSLPMSSPVFSPSKTSPKVILTSPNNLYVI